MSPYLGRRASAAALLVVVCVVGVALAYDGGPFAIDHSVMDWMVAHRNTTSFAVVSVISDCFGPVMIAVWAFIAAAVFAIRDRTLSRAIAVVATVAAAAVVTEIVKLVVARPRPPMIYHRSIPEMTYSYPSGHVTGTSALTITIAVVATATASPAVRRWALAAAAAITLFAAATRLYLGVHWASDVIAAFAVGTAAALVLPDLVAAGLDKARQWTPDRLQTWVAPGPLATRRTPTRVHR